MGGTYKTNFKSRFLVYQMVQVNTGCSSSEKAAKKDLHHQNEITVVCQLRNIFV